MELTGRERRYILLFSLIILLIPMIIFPRQLGTELAKASFINAFYELVFYGIVIFLFNSRVTLINLLQACGACLVYRFALGAVFGLLIAAAYAMDLRVAVTMGMSSYLPAIILHVVAVPFILRPALAQIYYRRPARRPARPVIPVEDTPRSGRSTRAARDHREPTARTDRTPSTRPTRQSASEESTLEMAARPVSGDATGFDRAVQYVGEHAAVELAAVIDHEGLLLANYCRGTVDPEDWAPLALLFLTDNARIADRRSLGEPGKVGVIFDDKRVEIARVDSLTLMVLSDRQSDDFLNIRINQAIEMIGKYYAERYSEQNVANAERTHVSSVE
jgi:predicted regulator of Ras-like GTPase activity (Roadblock/LC7/MglB family)